MGAKSNLSVSERREIVLSLLRREEPAGILARRHERKTDCMRDSYSAGRSRSACGGLTATSLGVARSRSAAGSERPRSGSFGWPAANASRVLPADAYRLVYRQEPLTKSNRVFPLEPHAKTFISSLRVSLYRPQLCT
jgi:hypothetical protein